MSFKINLLTGFLPLIIFLGCKKDNNRDNESERKYLKADFTFTLKNPGALPDTVAFTATAINATSYVWYFDDGNTAAIANPQNIYLTAKTYNVMLVCSNQYGADSITKEVAITLNKPTADFEFTVANQGTLPNTVSFINKSKGAVSYQWLLDNGDSSILKNPITNYINAKTYNVKLIAVNFRRKR